MRRILDTARFTRLLAAMTVVAACATTADPSAGLAPPLVQVDPARDHQQATATTPLGAPLRVTVTRLGAPLRDAAVFWSVDSGAGTITPLTARTDAHGVAEATWTLGQRAGTWRAYAAVEDAETPGTFTATTRPGPAATISAPHDRFVGVTGLTAPHALQIVVTDQYGNPVDGHPVAWSMTGPATVAANPVTGGQGILGAGLQFTAAGTATLRADAPGLVGSPRTFAITMLAAPVGVVDIEVGNDFFAPERVTVPSGTLVRWTLRQTSGASHNITPDGLPAFGGSAGNLAGDGATLQTLFGAPGTYRYLCTRHGRMTGTIVVE